jgi:hypothetical protein
MLNISIRLLGLIAVLIFAPECGAGKTVNTNSVERDHWSAIQLSITGGFTGRGNGTVVITSDGAITIDRPPMPGKRKPECEGKLSAEELKRLNTAISKGHPDGWGMGSPNVGVSDAFTYQLVLTVGKEEKAKSFTAMWFDNTGGSIPEDLKEIRDVIYAARKTVEENCK